MPLIFADERKKAVFRSARMTVEEYVSLYGKARREFAIGQLELCGGLLSDVERDECMAEFERLGLIPPSAEVIPIFRGGK